MNASPRKPKSATKPKTAAKANTAAKSRSKTASRAPVNARRSRGAPEAMQPTMRSPAKELGPRASRAISLILDATKSVFITRGYGGTTPAEIARVAGVSRTSFYTYFPSKRDALLALGLREITANDAMLEKLGEVPRPWNERSIREWVTQRFALLDEHAGFSMVWTQAAYEDEELRVAGMKQHLRSMRVFGEILGEDEPGDAEALGLTVFGMIERTWSYCDLYGDRVDLDKVLDDITRAILALSRGR